MKTPHENDAPQARSEEMRVTRRGFLGVAAGVAGVTTAVAAKLASADTQRAVADLLPVYGETKVATICHQCIGGCGLIARVFGDEVVSLKGNPEHPVNRGRVCARAFSSLELLSAPARVTGPMVKDGARGKLKPASWDEALTLVGERLGDLRGKKLAHTVAILGGQYRGTRDAIWAQFARAFGTPNYLRLRTGAPERPALAHRFMQGATSPMAYDLHEAQLIVSFGAGILEGWHNPVYATSALTRVRRSDDHQRGRFILIDPRRSPTAVKADRWVSLVPGTDGILALGIANALIREELYDLSFVEQHTLGFEDFAGPDGKKYDGFKTLVLRDYGLLAVSAATGVPVNTILEIARELGAAQPAVVIGERNGSYGADDLRTRMAIHALNALVGNLGKRGGVVPQTPLPLAPLPQVVPDEAATASLAQPRLDGAGQGDYLLAADVGQAVPARILQGAPYPVNALLLFATNPLVNHPARAEFAKALEKVPFVVSFSPFLDETTQAADVVLPDSIFLERWQDDAVSHLAGFSCYSVGAPAGPTRLDTRNTADVVLALSAKLGGGLEKALPFKSFEEALRHVARGLFEAKRGHLSGPMADEALSRTLERQGYWSPEFTDFDAFFEALVKRGAWYDATTLPIGRKATFLTESGKFEFHAPTLGALLDEAIKREGKASSTVRLMRPEGQAMLPAVAFPSTPASEPFPLRLNTYHLATRPLGGAANQPWLLEQPASHLQATWQTWVELHPATARELGIEDGQQVVVESAHGQVKLMARLNGGTREDLVHIPVYGGLGANPYDLIGNVPDYFGGFGLLGTTRVRVRRA